MEQFVDLLLQERSLLAFAVYRMEALHHFVQGIEPGYVELAANEASASIVKLHQIETARSDALKALTGSLGLNESPSLRQLREIRPDLASLFDELRADFQKLTDHLTGLTRSTRRVAKARSHEIEHVLRMVIGADPATALVAPTAPAGRMNRIDGRA